MAKKFVPTPEWADRLEWPNITVLAFDPSLSKTGWSYIRFAPFKRPVVIDYGNIKTAAAEDGKLNQEQVLKRAGLVLIEALPLVDIRPANRYAIESPVPGSFGVASQSGALIAATIQAAVIASGASADSIEFYHPKVPKKVVSGNGRAEKVEVKAAVFDWLGLTFRTNTDVTDSIAVGLTDVITNYELGDPR